VRTETLISNLEHNGAVADDDNLQQSRSNVYVNKNTHKTAKLGGREPKPCSKEFWLALVRSFVFTDSQEIQKFSRGAGYKM